MEFQAPDMALEAMAAGAARNLACLVTCLVSWEGATGGRERLCACQIKCDLDAGFTPFLSSGWLGPSYDASIDGSTRGRSHAAEEDEMNRSHRSQRWHISASEPQVQSTNREMSCSMRL